MITFWIIISKIKVKILIAKIDRIRIEKASLLIVNVNLVHEFKYLFLGGCDNNHKSANEYIIGKYTDAQHSKKENMFERLV